MEEKYIPRTQQDRIMLETLEVLKNIEKLLKDKSIIPTLPDLPIKETIRKPRNKKNKDGDK